MCYQASLQGWQNVLDRRARTRAHVRRWMRQLSATHGTALLIERLLLESGVRSRRGSVQLNRE